MPQVTTLCLLVAFMSQLVAGCTRVVPVPEPADLGDLSDLVEAYCETHPEVPCGHVWMCDTPAENDLGLTEICVLDEVPIETVEVELGPCVPTPRHPGPCYSCCGAGPGCVGCNAFNGCWCGP